MVRLARELEIWQFDLAVAAPVYIFMTKLSANKKPTLSRALEPNLAPPARALYHWPSGLSRCISSVCRACATQLFHVAHTHPHSRFLVKSAAMAPKAEKKPAKKVAKKVAGGKGKKGKSKVESFKIYIYKVLKQVRRRPS